MPPDQDQTVTPPPEPDLFEAAGDILERNDFAPELVQRVRDGFDYSETFTKHRLNVIEAADSALAGKLRKEIEAEAASKAADVAQRVEQERLEGLDAEQHARAMAPLEDEAATALHESELEKYIGVGGVSKAKELADVLSSREVSAAEALTAWDQADPITREVATQFGTGVVDFDGEELLGRGGAS